MTKRSLFSISELKRMADVANAESVTVELEREGTIIRVMPFTQPRSISTKASREEKADAALAAWIAVRKDR